MAPIVILTEPKQELEVLVNGTHHDQVAAKEAVNRVFEFAYVSKVCELNMQR
jgi:hypothetical protein